MSSPTTDDILPGKSAAKVARTLLRERDALRVLLDEARARVAESEAEVERGRRDTERLDWIDRNMDCILAGEGLHVSTLDDEVWEDHMSLRDAIDRAAAGDRRIKNGCRVGGRGGAWTQGRGR